MLDPKLLRSEPEAVARQLKSRNFELDVEKLKGFESRRKALQIHTQELQSRRNKKSGAVPVQQPEAEGQAANSSGKTSGEMSARELKAELKAAEAELSALQQEIRDYSLGIPNIPHESVPVGKDENDNREERRWGTPREFGSGELGFKPRDHVDLGEALGGIDTEAATRLTGSRFAVLSHNTARLHRALTQFMLDTHINEHGYTETYVPYIINSESLQGTGQLPKFEQDLFKLHGDSGYYLVPTAEVPVTNIIRDMIVDDDHMPRKWVAHTPCFRSEAGSYGKDTRGLIRQHQFEKVELVQAVRPHESGDALEQLTGHAEAILQKLSLPYRVLTLCTADTGFSAAKTYDLEVWLPGQQKYREISSCSNFTDFQARRLRARWRNPQTRKPELLHTINGSGVAVGRALIAVMENYQNSDGSITVPEVLRDYMGGLERITAQT